MVQARRAACCPCALALVRLEEALTNPGVSVSGDDALDLRVVGQVAHGVLNMLKMSDEIPSRSITIKAASLLMQERIFKKMLICLIAKSKNGFQ